MPKLSNKTKQRIQEQALHHLFTISPDSAFTNKIAEEIARDEEFTKALLLDLKSKSLVTEINKNPSGKDYAKRQRWRLSPQAHSIYSKHQQSQ